MLGYTGSLTHCTLYASPGYPRGVATLPLGPTPLGVLRCGCITSANFSTKMGSRGSAWAYLVCSWGSTVPGGPEIASTRGLDRARVGGKLLGMRFLRYFPQFFLLFSMSCAVGPSKDEPYAALPEYQEWWQTVEECSGATGDFGDLRFYILLPEDERGALGRSRGQDIWIRVDLVADAFVVKHEMLHALIGDGQHRSAAWRSCGVAP